MPTGMSLHIGINYLDANHYTDDGKPWEGRLAAAEADALAMYHIANQQGFAAKQLFSREATRTNVTEEILKASMHLVAGDTFFLSYAGHGGQVPDTSGDEGDGLDETWCLYDGQIIDDELLKMWSTFKEGVRVLIISDSCHSGTVFRSGTNRSTAEITSARREDGSRDKNHAVKKSSAVREAVTNQTVNGTQYRFMPTRGAYQTYKGNREFYDEILKGKNINVPEIKASIRQIAACRDNQLAKEGKTNGFFTETILIVWKNGRFKGDYDRFFKKIHRKMTNWWIRWRRGVTQEPWTEEFGMPDAEFKYPFTL